MKKVMIDGKEYFQQEQSDIDRLPSMTYAKDMLKMAPKEIKGIYGQEDKEADREDEAVGKGREEPFEGR